MVVTQGSIGPMVSLASSSECIVTAGVAVELAATVPGPHAARRTTDNRKVPGIVRRRPHMGTMVR
jgi:hypothetical protein